MEHQLNRAVITEFVGELMKLDYWPDAVDGDRLEVAIADLNGLPAILVVADLEAVSLEVAWAGRGERVTSLFHNGSGFALRGADGKEFFWVDIQNRTITMRAAGTPEVLIDTPRLERARATTVIDLAVDDADELLVG